MATTKTAKAKPTSMTDIADAIKKVGKNKYDSSSIDVRSGLAGIRTNASMYLGSTDAHGVFLSVRELLDNALDEHLAGRNKAVRLHIDTDGSYWVLDQGTGIPQGIKEAHMHVNGKDVVNKIPTMQAVFGELHTSGKYRTDAYKVSVGCFVGSTELRLLDGTITTFENLYQAWQLNQTPIPMMTWDTKLDKVAYSNISHVQLSKLTQDLVKVKVADQSIRCTPDHPFYVRTTSGIKKIQAKDLKSGMSLVSMHLKEDQDGNYNFSVISVKRYTTKEPVAVYGMTVDNQHTYFVEPGVLVGNTHGVGSKGTNACAEYFDVVTFYKGKWYSVGFKAGKVTSVVKQLAKAPKGPDGTALKTGTCIHFKPDPKIFSAKSFPPALAAEWAEIMSYMNPGFVIMISSAKGKKVFVSKKGPIEYVTSRITKLKVEQITPLVFEYKSDLADMVIAFTNCEGSEVRGFTNGLSNPEGGTHVNSAIDALYTGLCDYLIGAGKSKMVEVTVKAKKGEKGGKKPVFRASDFKEGLVGLINAKLHKAEFSAQNKAKLTDLRMGKDYRALATVEATAFFKKNPKLAITLAERATKLATMMFNFAKSKKLVASLGQLKRKGMPIKYVPPNKSTKIEDREIYIVEGESAGGGAKDARFPFQGVLPLKGKIANAIKMKGNKKRPDGALDSEEVIHVLGAIGFDPKATDPYEKLQTGKIVLLADPDPDGPLAGDTRVLTLDGSRPTIASLARNWTDLSEPFEVFSRNRKGELVIGLASHPRQVCLSDKTYTLHFDNGTKIECTAKHKWVPTEGHPKQVKLNGIPFVETRHLNIGDGINSMYTSIVKGKRDNSIMRYLQILGEATLPKRKFMVHQFVKLRMDPAKFAIYKSRNNGVTGGLIHIHHKNENSLDNRPANLAYLFRINHYRKHGVGMAADYNGSAKHLADLNNFYSSGEGDVFKKASGKRLAEYNRTEANSQSTAILNRREDIKALQQLGKCSRLLKTLSDLGIFSEELFNYHASHRAIPEWQSCIDRFGLKVISAKARKAKTLKLPNKYPKAEYPSQKISKFKTVCELAIAKFGNLSEDTYFAIKQSRDVRGDPRWESGLAWLGVENGKQAVKKLGLRMNHTITKIVINERRQKPMYCMTVEKYGNFMVDDGLGNGICSSNCHINTLLLGLYYQYLPDLYARGMVYVAKAPEFYAVHGGNLYTADGATALRSKLNKAGVPARVDVNHIKGWGEIDASLIKILAMDPATRTLIQIKPLEDSDNEFKLLMDEGVESRKKLLGIEN